MAHFSNFSPTIIFRVLSLVLLVGIGTEVKAQSNYEQHVEAVRDWQRGNYQDAINQFKRLTAAGYAESAETLGDIYFGGQNVQKDVNEGIYWYKKSARYGSEDIQFKLGRIYYYGFEKIAKDFKEAAKWFKMAAEQGDEDAQYLLASMYHNGEGVTKNLALAYDWYEEIAEGSGEYREKALYNLAAISYYKSDELPYLSPQMASKWLQKICYTTGKCNNPQFGIAEMAYYGKEIPVDRIAATEWYFSAVDYVRESKAINILKQMTNDGLIEATYFYAKYADLPEDEKKKHLTKAGNNGHKLASFEMHKIYDYKYNTTRGKVAEKYLAKSLDWLKKSAIDGYSTASLELYKYYAKDNRDCEEAIYWLKNARDNGSHRAETLLEGEDKYAKARLGISLNACN